MAEPRNRRLVVNMAIGIFGAIAIMGSVYFVFGNLDHRPPDFTHVIVGTVLSTLAVIWGCAFAVRAHFAEDEFQRHREISVWFWGGWLGIAASAPVLYFVIMGGLRWLAPGVLANIAMLRAFTLGYMLPILCAVIGGIVAHSWRRFHDRSPAP
jgi:hypothetical protein